MSAAALALTQARPLDRSEAGEPSALREAVEGLRFVRSQTWLWGTLLAASVAVAAFWDPVEVLVPYIVKNDLAEAPTTSGSSSPRAALAVVAAPVLAQRGLPRRQITFMYVVWTLAAAVIAGYGVATTLWQAMLVSFVSGATAAAGLVVWATLMQTLVPGRLLGRVQSVDWLVSIGLVPVSFAATGPLAAAIGHDETLIWAGAVSGVVTLAFLFLPGMRDPERSARGRYAAESATS